MINILTVGDLSMIYVEKRPFYDQKKDQIWGQMGAKIG